MTTAALNPQSLTMAAMAPLQSALLSLRQMDRGLLMLLVGLTVLGVVMVATSSIALGESYTGDAHYFLKRHMVNLSLALAAALFCCCAPMRWWQQSSILLLVAGAVLLVAVLIPGIGVEIKGARRWINLGVMNLQATEIARLCALVYFADYLVRRRSNLANEFRGILIPAIVLASYGCLIGLQPDLGSTILLAAACFTLLFLGGLPVGWVLTMGVMMLLVVVALIFSADYRAARLLTFLAENPDIQGSGYQAWQSMTAIARGGWFGVGLGNSLQKFLYLPEVHTDYVFAVFAEEFGLLAVVSLLGLFAWLLIKGFGVGRAAALRDAWFSAYMAWGVSVALLLQVVVHVLVNVGLAPSTGVVLPYMSYGGSALLATGMMSGLLLRVSVENNAHQSLSAEARRQQSRGGAHDSKHENPQEETRYE